MACRTWVSQLLFASRSTARPRHKTVREAAEYIMLFLYYVHKAYSQMRQLKEKHATKYASLHSSLLYRKRIDVTVENDEGPLIVWAGVIGTEGLPWVIIAVSRHEPGVPRACIDHVSCPRLTPSLSFDMTSLISTTWVCCNHVVLPSTPVHYHTYYC
jgi:hypothetical protein